MAISSDFVETGDSHVAPFGRLLGMTQLEDHFMTYITYILLNLLSILAYLLPPLSVLAAVLIIRHFIHKRNGSENTGRTQKWSGTLNTIMLTSVGITIFRAVVDYIYLIILRPDRYAITSFPWYTNSLLYGAGTLLVLLVCFIIKRKTA